MAVQSDSGGKDDLKTQFVTREGTYRLMTLSEYSRPNRVGYTSSSGSSHVRVSLVTLPPAPTFSDSSSDTQTSDDRICFNHGKELYVYVYRGIKKAADLTKPVDKKMYKGTNPTCHDFNSVTMTHESVSLVIGFSTGQIQLIDPIKRELSKLYNEERLIDKSRVTCIKWVPGSSNLFMAAHASGQLYVYNEELGCGAAAPAYQLFKQGDAYSIHTCRAKSTRNPLYRWVIGEREHAACINEFAFSPGGANLAVASQDGLLRVFHYDTMELVGRARSYFGGFLCVCWSPDGKYVVVGGEDDLVTVWSLAERRVAARGQGHRSWVSVVAFDPYAAASPGVDGEREGEGDADEPRDPGACYRLGSVSHDTQLCLWDLTEDVLRPPLRARASAHLSPALELNGAPPKPAPDPPPPQLTHPRKKEDGGGSLGVNSLTARFAGFSFGERQHRRHASLAARPVEATGGGGVGAARPADAVRLMGTPACPRFDECPVLEPLVCKKIAHERLTALLFRSEYFLTACADGCVNTWARPAATRATHAPHPHTHTHAHAHTHTHAHAPHNGDARARRPDRTERSD